MVSKRVTWVSEIPYAQMAPSWFTRAANRMVTGETRRMVSSVSAWPGP